MNASTARGILGMGVIGQLSRQPTFIGIGLAASTFGFLPASLVLRAAIVAALAALCDVAFFALPVSERASSRLVLDRWVGVWAALLVVPDVLGAVVAVAGLTAAANAWPPPPLTRLASALGRRRAWDDVAVAVLVGPLVRALFGLLH